jgi:hypothetical protein
VAWVVVSAVAALVAVGAILVWRRPALALYAFVVGLILNNTVFLLLYAAGARGWQLTAAQAWKEALLAVALARITRDSVAGHRLPFRPAYADAAAALFGLIVLAYALVPQHLLGGAAGPKAELYGLRHYLVPVAAYFAGRSLPLRRMEVRRVVLLMICAAATTAAAGIVEEYTVTVAQWHRLGAGRYYTNQLEFPALHGPGGLPENFVFNSSDGLHRRLVSFFLSPLASAYFFVVAIALVAAGAVGAGRRKVILVVASVLAFAGLLFTFTRSALAALPIGLLLIAVMTRRRLMFGIALVTVAAAAGFAAVYPNVAPRTHFLAADLPYQRHHAKISGGLPKGKPLETSVTLSDPSFRSHLSELRSGGRNLFDHPQGYGVGNSGETAARFQVPPRAGESFYLELGADAGVGGLFFWLLFTALTLGGLLGVVRGRVSAYARTFAAGVLAAGTSIAALALISDVWGAPWLSYVLWWISGAALTTGESDVTNE